MLCARQLGALRGSIARSRFTKNCVIWYGKPNQIHFLYNCLSRLVACGSVALPASRVAPLPFLKFHFMRLALTRSKCPPHTIKQNVDFMQRNKSFRLGLWRTVSKAHIEQIKNVGFLKGTPHTPDFSLHKIPFAFCIIVATAKGRTLAPAHSSPQASLRSRARQKIKLRFIFSLALH